MRTDQPTMLSPAVWLFRHLRQLRLSLILCLVVSYCTIILISSPVLAYFDQLLRSLENTASKLDEATKSDSGLSYATSTELIKSKAAVIRVIKTRHVPESKSKMLLPVVDNTTSGAKLIAFEGSQPSGVVVSDDVSVKDGHKVITPDLWNLSTYPMLLNSWSVSRMQGCGNRMDLYASEFAYLRNVVIDRRFCHAKVRGGEPIEEVLQQQESVEYYQTIRHCFQLDCNNGFPFGYSFNGKNFLNDWLLNLKTLDFQLGVDAVTEPGFTVALARREYANLYHTVNEWYNLFLLMVFFRKRPEETNILLVDAHPRGKLDSAWPVLFNSTRILSELPARTLFADMVWGMQGSNSVLKQRHFLVEGPPLLEEFRQFFLDRFQLNGSKSLNCSNLSVLFIWRRDYLAHPRNPTGLVKRKIDNEEELLSVLGSRHKDFRIRGVQIDTFSMRDQVKLVSDADIVVGMHGAGLSHTLFIQPHGAMIELAPSYYGSDNDHFMNLAKWRGLAVERWVNTDIQNEKKNFRTRIPVDAMDFLLRKISGQICSESQKTRLERRFLRRPGRYLRKLNPVVPFHNPPERPGLVQRGKIREERFRSRRFH